MKKVLLFLICCCYVFCSGCGLVAVVGTPTRHEQKVKAEYDITKDTDKTILVLVKQHDWLRSERNIAANLTRAVQNNMIKNSDLEVKNFITYENLGTFRENNQNYAVLSPAQTGFELDADLVLLIEVTRFNLINQAQSSYFRGTLDANASLYDAQSGAKLWPVDEEEARQIRVGYDLGMSDTDKAFKKLVADAAHCTVRYLRDCSVADFRISGERTGEGWEDWER